VSEPISLITAAAQLGVSLSERQVAQLLQLLDELARWSRSYNLTAILEREAMITHHLLDSLAVVPLLQGRRIIDVGTGAGFPGLPLAIACPDRHFTLLDSNGKKIRFVAHAARVLQLANVSAVHARAETHTVSPAEPYDTVIARAFAPLPELLQRIAGLCSPVTCVLAMKGPRVQQELEVLPAGWRLQSEHEIEVPGLGAQRHVVVLRPAS